jgi:hypothetical protein
MTEPTRAEAGPAPARPTRKRGHAALGGRILVAGLAAGSGLGLVGAMSAAARSSTPTAAADPVHRVIVVDRTTEAPPAPDAASTPATVAPEPAPLPRPPLPDPQPAPPVTQSQGS